jgi:hypothetical protein
MNLSANPSLDERVEACQLDLSCKWNSLLTGSSSLMHSAVNVKVGKKEDRPLL